MKWLENNLIPPWNGGGWTSISGGASISSLGIQLPVSSTMRLVLDKGGIVQGSSKLRFTFRFNGLFSEDESYRPRSSVDIKIVYLDNTIQTFRIILSKLNKVGVEYVDDIELDVEQKNMSKVEIYFNNYGIALGTLIIKEVRLYKSEDVNKDQIAGAIEEIVSLKRLISYDNGCMVEWKGDIKSLKLEFITGLSNEFLGILVDDDDFIPYERVAGLLP